MYVEVGRGAEALYQRDRAAVAFASLEPGSLQQMARNHALHHLQHRRHQLRLRGQQHGLQRPSALIASMIASVRGCTHIGPPPAKPPGGSSAMAASA